MARKLQANNLVYSRGKVVRKLKIKALNPMFLFPNSFLLSNPTDVKVRGMYRRNRKIKTQNAYIGYEIVESRTSLLRRTHSDKR